MIIFVSFFLAVFLPGCAPPHPSTELTPAGARFSIRLPDARSVAVVGDFNRWNRSSDPLAGPDKNGIWSRTVALPEGRYEYLFLVDETAWVPDPSALSADDGMGGTCSVLFVPPADAGR